MGLGLGLTKNLNVDFLQNQLHLKYEYKQPDKLVLQNTFKVNIKIQNIHPVIGKSSRRSHKAHRIHHIIMTKFTQKTGKKYGTDVNCYLTWFAEVYNYKAGYMFFLYWHWLKETDPLNHIGIGIELYGCSDQVIVLLCFQITKRAAFPNSFVEFSIDSNVQKSKVLLSLYHKNT